VDENILRKTRAPELRVYAVWIHRMRRDTRPDIDPAVFDDERATVYWDGDQISGKFYAAAEGFHSKVAWDSYYLYPPEAHWRAMAAPITAAGFPVMNFRDDLKKFMRQTAGR
jgi:hypothetical protein